MEIPQDARYGIWDQVAEQWTGDWLYTDSEAIRDECSLQRSGGAPFSVVGVNGVDDSWLDGFQD